MILELTQEEYQEIIRDWDNWNDESYAIHAGYILREAMKRADNSLEEL